MSDTTAAQRMCAKCGEALYNFTVTVGGAEYHPGCVKIPSWRERIRELEAEVERLRDEVDTYRDSCEAKADRIDRLGEMVENDTALLRQALEALTVYDGENGASKRKRVLDALRAHLSEPERTVTLPPTTLLGYRMYAPAEVECLMRDYAIAALRAAGVEVK